MANLVLPDSNIYIDALRAGLDPFRQFAGHLDAWEFVTCGMVMVEVLRGLREPNLVKRFRERFAVMVIIPSTEAVWDRATQLAWTLDRRGAVIPATDLVIAACALHVNAEVMTRDAHFYAIPGLRVRSELN